ncbi:TerB family tellurite resistance protein [Pseudoalteromonas sp. SSDWG2]|uniref:tellurite resistance TerB family protein n=1 Tax=Pseudoalteromonas sp. SSDWG2 TaxID=3139391 RepID=UPI003BABD56C
MLDKISRFFNSLNEQSTVDERPDFKTAVAALLIEVMRADNTLDKAEQDMIFAVLQRQFELSAEQASVLINQASSDLDDAIDYFRFSKQINEHTSAEERIEILTLLWRLAYADGHLDKHEEHVIRKVADLLYVTHNDFIRAKLAAQEQER